MGRKMAYCNADFRTCFLHLKSPVESASSVWCRIFELCESAVPANSALRKLCYLDQ